MYTFFNILFSLLNILLGWIPFGKLPAMDQKIINEIESIGELTDSLYGEYYVIDSKYKDVNGYNLVSKKLHALARLSGGGFCNPLTGLVVIDKSSFGNNEELLKAAILAHEFGHCHYQGDGSWMWNSCWFYSLREIQADFFAWKTDPIYAKELLFYINKYLPRKSWKDAYLYASVYLFRVLALRILTMIK